MATIYKILSPCLKECYVGSTTQDVEVRWGRHMRRGGTTTAEVLFEKYGVENCKFVVMEVCPIEERRAKEQWWLDHSVGVVNEKNPIKQQTPEQRSEYMKTYYENHKEAILANAADYQKQHADQIRERKHNRYMENRDEISTQQKANRNEATLARERIWQAQNREKLNAQARARRAAKKSE